MPASMHYCPPLLQLPRCSQTSRMPDCFLACSPDTPRYQQLLQQLAVSSSIPLGQSTSRSSAVCDHCRLPAPAESLPELALSLELHLVPSCCLQQPTAPIQPPPIRHCLEHPRPRPIRHCLLHPTSRPNTSS